MSEDGYEELEFTSHQLAAENKSYEHHPVDDLEPVEEQDSGYIAASKRFLFLMNQFISFIKESENKGLATDIVGFSIGSAAIPEKTMDAVGAKHGVGRAAVSKQVKTLQRMCNLEPSGYMKSTLACLRYSKARNASVKSNQEEEKE